MIVNLGEITKRLAKFLPARRENDILESTPVAIGKSFIAVSAYLVPVDISRVLDSLAILKLLDECSLHVMTSCIFERPKKERKTIVGHSCGKVHC